MDGSSSSVVSSQNSKDNKYRSSIVISSFGARKIQKGRRVLFVVRGGGVGRGNVAGKVYMERLPYLNDTKNVYRLCVPVDGS